MGGDDTAQQAARAERVFAPLPGRTEDARTEFHRRLLELIRMFGTTVGAQRDAGAARQWERGARNALRRAAGERPDLPQEFFAPLLDAAVHDPAPSFNRQFVEPLLRGFGRRRVQLALLDRLRTGTDRERAGAARAWYWTGLPSRRPGGETESERTADVVAAWHEAVLREFVADDHLDVRRCIRPGLPHRPAAYPPHLHALVDTAVEIARAHRDDYVRHRVEVQVHG
jgi:hypothetical protein